MSNVSYCLPEYSECLPDWQLIRHCMEGERSIKRHGDKYLPRPNPADDSEENKLRYEQYKTRAVFYNVTRRTVLGLIGQVFRKNPEYTIPASLEFIKADVDGGGVSLWAQCHKTLMTTLAYSRCGLFVDYPAVPGAVSRRQMEEEGIRPTIVRYDPWDIINWRTRRVNGEHRLSMVVLKERQPKREDEEDGSFEVQMEDVYRVLRLDRDNLYEVEIYRSESKGGLLTASPGETYRPMDSRGRRLNYIPFIFAGAVNNDPDVDYPLMLDIAGLNIAHYRNSADYEENVYMCGQVTPYLTGLTDDWVENHLSDGVRFGNRGGILLPENGTAGMLQAQEKGVIKEAMDQKEQQMIALGAKIIETSNVERREVEVLIRDFGEHSVLTTVTQNVSEAYEKALMWAQEFVSDSQEIITYQLNRDFQMNSLDANEQAQLVAMWQSGILLESEVRKALLGQGLATEDYNTFKDRRDTEGPPEWALGLPAGADQNLQGEQ